MFAEDSEVDLPRPRPGLRVVAAGLLTTVATLSGVYLLARFGDDCYIMGWYAYFVVPIGAMLVGLVAASGYAWGSWWTGTRITRTLLGYVLLLQFLAYWGAEYLDFLSRNLVFDDGTPVGFWLFFDHMTRAFGFEDNGPMGAWGYLFRLLEVVGFCGGSVWAPAILWNAPYCGPCESYMRRKELALVPAGIVPLDSSMLRSGDGRTAHTTGPDREFPEGREVSARLLTAAAAGDSIAWDAILQQLPAAKSTRKSRNYFLMQLVSCPACRSGHLEVCHVYSAGTNPSRQTVAEASVTAEFVRQTG